MGKKKSRTASQSSAAVRHRTAKARKARGYRKEGPKAHAVLPVTEQVTDGEKTKDSHAGENTAEGRRIKRRRSLADGLATLLGHDDEERLTRHTAESTVVVAYLQNLRGETQVRARCAVAWLFALTFAKSRRPKWFHVSCILACLSVCVRNRSLGMRV